VRGKGMGYMRDGNGNHLRKKRELSLIINGDTRAMFTAYSNEEIKAVEEASPPYPEPPRPRQGAAALQRPGAASLAYLATTAGSLLTNS
jgi:hypothetical protein